MGLVCKITVTEDFKRHVLWAIGKVKLIVEGEKVPREMSHEKCRSCGYRKICKGV